MAAPAVTVPAQLKTGESVTLGFDHQPTMDEIDNALEDLQSQRSPVAKAISGTAQLANLPPPDTTSQFPGSFTGRVDTGILPSKQSKGEQIGSEAGAAMAQQGHFLNEPLLFHGTPPPTQQYPLTDPNFNQEGGGVNLLPKDLTSISDVLHTVIKATTPGPWNDFPAVDAELRKYTDVTANFIQGAITAPADLALAAAYDMTHTVEDIKELPQYASKFGSSIDFLNIEGEKDLSPADRFGKMLNFAGLAFMVWHGVGALKGGEAIPGLMDETSQKFTTNLQDPAYDSLGAQKWRAAMTDAVHEVAQAHGLDNPEFDHFAADTIARSPDRGGATGGLRGDRPGPEKPPAFDQTQPVSKPLIDNTEPPVVPPTEAPIPKVNEAPPIETGGVPTATVAKGGVEPPGNDVVPEGHGIAQEVHDTRAAKGEIQPIEPGVGTTPEEMVKIGRESIKSGTDPEQVLQDFEKTQAISGNGMAVLRAHAEDLARSSRDAIQEGNPQTIALAKKTEQDWLSRIKPASTEWHKIGQAQQGVTDLDTGDWTALTSKRADVGGKQTLTKGEVIQAKNLSGEVNRLSGEVKRLSDALDASLKQKATSPKFGVKEGGSRLPTDPEALKAHFQKRIESGSLFQSKLSKQTGAIDLSGKPHFTDAEIRSIWQHAKENYIDPMAKGGEPKTLSDIANGTAEDLGLHPDWVKDVIAGRKTPERLISSDLYRAMAERRKAVQSAKDWAEQGPMTAGKAVRGIFRTLRQAPGTLAVTGHGTVAMFTHAGPILFEDAPTWVQHFKDQFKMAFSEPVHEEMMQTMEHRPLYNQALQDGLKIGRQYKEDYGFFTKVFGGKLAGSKGMDILKPLRLSKYENMMANAPDWAKADPTLGKQFADLLNHASGGGDIPWLSPKGKEVAREFMFAPSLEAARWSAMIGDSAKTVKTFMDWGNASPAEKYVAVLRMKRAGRILAWYGSALAVNQALLSAAGHDESINFLDPWGADWLKFKWGKSTFDLTGGRFQPLRESINVLHATVNDAIGESNPYHQNALQLIESYARGKLAPQYGIAADAIARSDFVGRPVPWSDDPGTADKPRYTWPEYIAAHGPIPAADASKALFDGLREGGVDSDTAWKITGRLLIAASGVREGVANKVKPKDALANAIDAGIHKVKGN